MNPLWTCHFSPELEILENHAKKGDQIYVVECNADLSFCDANPKHTLKKCIECNLIQNEGFGSLCKKPRILKYSHFFHKTKVPVNLSLEKFKKKYFKEFDFGQATFSSLTDISKSTKPSLKKYFLLSKKIVSSCCKVFLNADKMLRSIKFSSVIVFNGRFAVSRAWVRACQQNKTPFFTHERMLGQKSVNITKNDLPHNPDNYLKKIKVFYKNKLKRSYLKESAKYLKFRQMGIDSAWPSWVTKQKHGLLSSENIPDKYFVYFSTTERENSAVETFIKRPLFKDQISTVKFLADTCNQLKTKLVVRIHPASKYEQDCWWEDKLIKSLNIIIIKPDSIISSYELLKKSKKVIVASSTLGVEACFLKKPAIATDIIYYKSLNIVYEPKTKEQLKKLLASEIKPKPRLNAIKYIAYELFGGYRLKLCEPITNFYYTFKAKKLGTKKDLKTIFLTIRITINYFYNKLMFKLENTL